MDSERNTSLCDEMILQYSVMSSIGELYDFSLRNYIGITEYNIPFFLMRTDTH